MTMIRVFVTAAVAGVGMTLGTRLGQEYVLPYVEKRATPWIREQIRKYKEAYNAYNSRGASDEPTEEDPIKPVDPVRE